MAPSSDLLERACSTLHAIGLDEVNARAALQTRVDRKYVVDGDVAQSLLTALSGQAHILSLNGQRLLRYESVYFDTPSLLAYRLAARKRPEAFKVRIRSYMETGDCFVEIKTRNRAGQTVKQRVVHTADHRSLDAPARTFLGEVGGVRPSSTELGPTLTVTYRRATIVLPDGTRATFDSSFSARDERDCAVSLGDRVVVETKSRAARSLVDALLRDHGQHQVPISKYATSLAALNPSLPSNRWARTLRRYYVR